ncbi:BQ5605_C004g02655 [Microbotryum silenes-dioicae]|uniref:BQ5605_C004g02655 protein n=1 Tax=Microbotryum silenes-dioicae TaxID=796604 RepID=A0A2X0PAT6_9BASI|nr:BQ5605_C004g02655 [Microbotryum silenes-dioicae]
MPNIARTQSQMAAEDWSNWIFTSNIFQVGSARAWRWRSRKPMSCPEASSGARSTSGTWNLKGEQAEQISMPPNQLYYNGRPAHLKIFPYSSHAVLHIADFILWHGPPCSTWCFVIERYNQHVKRLTSTRKLPYSAIMRGIMVDNAMKSIAAWYPAVFYPASKRKVPSGNKLEQPGPQVEQSLGDGQAEPEAVEGCEFIGAKTIQEEKLSVHVKKLLITYINCTYAVEPNERTLAAARKLLPKELTIAYTAILNGSRIVGSSQPSPRGPSRREAFTVRTTRRDCSWISYTLFVDEDARRSRNRSRPFVGVEHKFYGEALEFYRFNLAHPVHGETEHTVVVVRQAVGLVAVGPENAQHFHNIYRYKKQGPLEAVPVQQVLTVAGRLHRKLDSSFTTGADVGPANVWYFCFDRPIGIAQAVFDDGDDSM